MTSGLATVLAGLVGACVGSFLNVVIWRLPRGESVAQGRSHCPRCGHGIRWFDNVPVLSWILLRARCRDCKAPISIRYPLVEALTAGLFLLVATRFDLLTQTAVASVTALVLAALVAVSFVDIDRREIPDAITKPGIVIGLLVSLVLAGLRPSGFLPEMENRHLAAFLRGALGALTGAGILLLVRWSGHLLFKKEAMGLGDVKLLAMVGAFTGPIDVLLALLLASVGGSVIGGFYVLARAKTLAPLAGTVSIDGGDKRPFDRARIYAPRRGPVLVAALVDAQDAVPVGTKSSLDVVLPGKTVWSEDGKDVRLSLRGVVERVDRVGDRALVATKPAPLPEADEDWLRTFALQRVSIPFGVFLSLGAAAVLLYGPEVEKFVTQTWPRFVTGR